MRCITLYAGGFNYNNSDGNKNGKKNQAEYTS